MFCKIVSVIIALIGIIMAVWCIASAEYSLMGYVLAVFPVLVCSYFSGRFWRLGNEL